MYKTKLTPIQYAEKRGISPQAVTKAIRRNSRLPSVTKVEKYGRFYLLTVQLGENGNLRHNPNKK